MISVSPVEFKFYILKPSLPDTGSTIKNLLMEIKHRENGHKGSFYIEENGSLLAELTYSFAGADKIIIDHTEVLDPLRGHGLGNELIDACVAYARDKSIRIVPLCSFAKSVFDKTTAYRDVLIN